MVYSVIMICWMLSQNHSTCYANFGSSVCSASVVAGAVVAGPGYHFYQVDVEVSEISTQVSETLQSSSFRSESWHQFLIIEVVSNSTFKSYYQFMVAILRAQMSSAWHLYLEMPLLRGILSWFGGFLILTEMVESLRNQKKSEYFFFSQRFETF